LGLSLLVRRAWLAFSFLACVSIAGLKVITFGVPEFWVIAAGIEKFICRYGNYCCKK
jgi:hypothetical protein